MYYTVVIIDTLYSTRLKNLKVSFNFRLFVLSQEKELQIHVFPGIPDPGDFCAGESTVSAKYYTNLKIQHLQILA